MDLLLERIRNCQICQEYLPLGPRPVLQASPDSRILIIGQAPGKVVHESGIAWDDASGKNLRSWLGCNSDQFYDPGNFALIPMGFCYPGTGKSGDLPPRKECAPEWHEALLSEMPDIKLRILLGKYAQNYYWKKGRAKNLTELIKFCLDSFREQAENDFLILPHPSPRNNIWQKKNPWFKEEFIPLLQEYTTKILAT
jgi:uracil-DNA glycosylase